MGLRFVIGSSGSGKSYRVYQEIIERSIQEPATDFLIVVPDQFTMQTQKDFVTMHPRGGIMNIDVLSFSRLAHRVFEEVGGDERPVLDDTGKSLVLRKIAGQLAGKLPVIGGNIRKIGYIHEVKSAISEFMQYGISPVEMTKMVAFSRKRGALYSKLMDLEVLYQGFLDYIKNEFITTEESLDLLKQVLFRSKIVKDSVVVFDGFTGFTPIQNRVIQELMSLSKELIVTIVLDGRENPYLLDGEQKLFHLSKKTIASLERLAKESGIVREKDVVLKEKPCKRFRNNKSLAHLEETIFRYPISSFQEEQDSIAIFFASTPKEEIRQVGRKIRSLIREEGYCYRDIAVITGDLGTYSNHVEEEFRKFEIPCFVDQTNGIVLNPFIEYIKSALQVLNRNFSYESMFHFLRCGLIDLKSEEIDLLENYVLGTGLKGKKAWNNLFTRQIQGFIESEELEQLNRIREQIMEMLSPLLTKQDKVEELVKGLYQFLVSGEAEKKLIAFENNFLKNGDFVRAKEYTQIYRLVMELLDQVIGLLGNETMSREEFAEILDAGFGEIEVGTIPQNVDRVVVGDMERTRLKSIRALFFVGINDGNIPKNTGKGGIISDIDREFLAESDFELAPTPRQQMYIQRLYLYMNMTKPTEKLFLSYAKTNNDGKAVRPAYLIDLVKKMYPNLMVTFPEGDRVEMQMETREDGIEYFTKLLCDYGQDCLEEDKKSVFYTLFSSFWKEEHCRPVLELLLDSAFYQYQNKPISKAIANVLYGTILENSVSRLEKFAACAYSHFLQYGLTLQEREEYSFEEVDMGNVFHGVLEQFSKRLEEGPFTWFDFPDTEGERMVEEALEHYAVEYGETVLFSSARNQYAIKRMQRILKRTVKTMQYQLKKGIFKPSRYEVAFSTLQDLESVNVTLSEEEKMRLRGRIDRVDTMETEEQLYVKVVDYKSGHKSFDLISFYHGLQLQLVVYLNAALDLEKKSHPEKEVIPAAILYYHMADPYVQTEYGEVREEELNQKIRKELRMTGLVNDKEEVLQSLDRFMVDKSDVIPVEKKKDGTLSKNSCVLTIDEFQDISNYVNLKVKEIGSRILAGEIEVNPFEQGVASACTYCSYKNVCGFDHKIEGYQKRDIEKISKEEALEEIKKTLQ